MAFKQKNVDSKVTVAESYENQSERTGLIYYEDCVSHSCIWDEMHQENPKRFTRSLERLKELDLIEKCQVLKPRRATKDEILQVHSEEYFERVKKTSAIFDPDALEKEASQYDAVYFTPNTFDCAMWSAGSAIELAGQICRGSLRNGFALIRPPGHHAMKEEACGYCFFNNVSIAAQYCLNQFQMKRILIVDWDVHHGQATQQAFYNDERVIYVSLHRYEFGAFWPELIQSNYNFIGEGSARGRNINVPLNDIGLCDSDYLAIWHNLLLPIFYQFNPELVLVSAGYDAAIGCPEGEMLLTPAVFGHLTHYLMALANGKVCVLLEGGYCVESLADCVAMTVQTLLGRPPMPLKMRYPLNQSVIESVLDSISVLRSYWNMLHMQRTFNRHDGESGEQIDNEGRKRHYSELEYRGRLDLLLEKPKQYPTRNGCPIQPEDVKEKYKKSILVLRDYAFNQSKNLERKKTCLITVPELDQNSLAFFKNEAEGSIHASSLGKKLQSLSQKCILIEDSQRLANEEQILFCHNSQVIELLRNTQKKFQAAQLAVGALLEAVDQVLNKNSLNGFACVWPPGHHASRQESVGCCFLNNVAIAAQYALNNHSLKRVLIVDLDIHHGDGTQNIVSDDERILFISLHRYDHAEYYPNKLNANYSNASKNIVNIPWNNGPISDKEYLSVFFNIILPIGHNFQPELVFISAGFDAGQNDFLGGYKISPTAYSHMTHLLCSLANGQVIISLEGGYDSPTITDCAYECILALMGEPLKPLSFSDEPLNGCAIETIQNVIDYQSTRWPCFTFNVDITETKI